MITNRGTNRALSPALPAILTNFDHATLADVGAAEEGGEFGMAEPAHRAPSIELNSIMRARFGAREPS